MFGLGSILCVILTGKPAHTGKSGQEMLIKAMNGDLRDAQVRLAACGADAELIDLARRCLAAEKTQRPRDAGAVSQAVLTYQAGVQERLRAAELARAAAQAKAQRGPHAAEGGSGVGDGGCLNRGRAGWRWCVVLPESAASEVPNELARAPVGTRTRQ